MGYMLGSSCSSCCKKCGTRSNAGGAGITIENYDMPFEAGDIQFIYEAYGVPDRFTVSDNDNNILFDTGGPVSGSKIVYIYKPKGVVLLTVRVEGPQGTAWTYTIGCPQVGACCNGSKCTTKPQSQCVAPGEIFQGFGTNCIDSPCEPCKQPDFCSEDRIFGVLSGINFVTAIDEISRRRYNDIFNTTKNCISSYDCYVPQSIQGPLYSLIQDPRIANNIAIEFKRQIPPSYNGDPCVIVYNAQAPYIEWSRQNGQNFCKTINTVDGDLNDNQNIITNISIFRISIVIQKLSGNWSLENNETAIFSIGISLQLMGCDILDGISHISEKYNNRFYPAGRIYTAIGPEDCALDQVLFQTHNDLRCWLAPSLRTIWKKSRTDFNAYQFGNCFEEGYFRSPAFPVDVPEPYVGGMSLELIKVE